MAAFREALFWTHLFVLVSEVVFKGGLEGVWGSAGAVLGAYKRRLGDVLGPLEAMLEPSGSEQGPQMEPKLRNLEI